MVELNACPVFLALSSLPGEEPKPPVLSDVFEVFTIESNNTGTDGTCGEGNQIDSRITIVTSLPREHRGRVQNLGYSPTATYHHAPRQSRRF